MDATKLLIVISDVPKLIPDISLSLPIYQKCLDAAKLGQAPQLTAEEIAQAEQDVGDLSKFALDVKAALA